MLCHRCSSFACLQVLQNNAKTDNTNLERNKHRQRETLEEEKIEKRI